MGFVGCGKVESCCCGGFLLCFCFVLVFVSLDFCVVWCWFSWFGCVVMVFGLFFMDVGCVVMFCRLLFSVCVLVLVV